MEFLGYGFAVGGSRDNLGSGSIYSGNSTTLMGFGIL